MEEIVLSKHEGKPSLASVQVQIYKEEWPGKGLALTQPSSSNIASKNYLECVLELFKGLLRGAFLGFGVKGVINALLALLKRKPSSVVLNEFFGKDTQDFSRFLSVFCGVFRFVNCLLATYFNKDTADNSRVAGAVAAVSILLDSPERRKSVALYLFVRAIAIDVRKYYRLGYLPKIPFFQELMFGICNIPIVYEFLYEPDMLQPGYYKWILSMGNVPEFGVQYTFRDVRNARFNGNIELPFRPCQPHYHQGPCHEYIAKDYILGLGRAGKIYLPVHLLPLILFKSNALLKKPVATLLHSVKGYISSCFFLSTYVFCLKFVVCYGRNTLKKDHSMFAVVSALLTGVATLLERESRVTELMLYCWPHALGGAFNFLFKRKMIFFVKFWEVPLFMYAMMTLFSSLSVDCKPTFYKLAKIAIGS